MSKILIVSLLFLAHFSGFVGHEPDQSNGKTRPDKMAQQTDNIATTFILLRHAEKAGAGNDPNLSEDGQLRAEALRHTLADVQISAIYSTPYNRTRQTVAGLAADKKVAVTQYEANKPPRRLIDEILALNKGKTVVIVGHSNTIPEIVKTLGASSTVTIGETQYDNLFIVNYLDATNANVINLKYGNNTH